MAEKEHMNLVIIGHVDHGKSTLTGRILLEAGAIDPHLVEKYKKEAEEKGKGTFYFAWIMDGLKEERERGVTIDVAHKKFYTDKYYFTVIDALAKSGDLTINGNRRAVMVSRNNNGVNEVHQIDLTDMQKTMLSDGYYLQQNDLVYVTPNDKRKRDSTNTGNLFHTPYIWMSIISMLASLIAIFK